ncbi:putative RNA-directed DNA polymerase [Tanacetum coccineum]
MSNGGTVMEYKSSYTRDDSTFPSSTKGNAEFVDKSASTEGSTNNNAKPDSSLAVASDSAHHTTSTSKLFLKFDMIILIATSNDEGYEFEAEEFAKFDLLKNYELQGKVKYGLNRYVNYANLTADNYSFVTNLNKSIKPKTYKEASTDSKWIEPMNDEMEALNRNGTWEITDLPKGRKHVGSKWISKIKYRANGEIERCVLYLAVQNNWLIFQLDVNNSFLYGELVEDVYMSLPKGLFVHGDQRVCNLNKSLYGLKSGAHRMWNEKFSSVLFYVDDIIITGNSIDEIDKFKKLFIAKFMIKDRESCGTLRVLQEWGVITKLVIGFELNALLTQIRPTEAEYMAMSNIACEIIWILKLLTDLKVEYSNPV